MAGSTDFVRPPQINERMGNAKADEDRQAFHL